MKIRPPIEKMKTFLFLIMQKINVLTKNSFWAPFGHQGVFFQPRNRCLYNSDVQNEVRSKDCLSL